MSPTPTWFLDELAHAGDEHLDPAYVPGYDRKAGTDPAEDLAALRMRGLSPDHTLIDLGAGTGTFALAAAPFCRRVVAVDVSPLMLGRLREKAAGLGIANVEPVLAGFLSYQHQGPPAEAVYTRHALHHLPDAWKALALARIAAILRPGGVLFVRDLIFSCAPGEAPAVIDSWLDGASASPELGWTRAELETHLRTEHSTFNWLLEPMLERAGFAIEEAFHAPSRIYSTYVCVRG